MKILKNGKAAVDAAADGEPQICEKTEMGQGIHEIFPHAEGEVAV